MNIEGRIDRLEKLIDQRSAQGAWSIILITGFTQAEADAVRRPKDGPITGLRVFFVEDNDRPARPVVLLDAIVAEAERVHGTEGAEAVFDGGIGDGVEVEG